MPEGYTHVRTANRAADLAGLNIENPAAFGCGANGPDILFCYRVWKKAARRGENLPEIGGRLHDENTGPFLMSLVKGARTPSEKSYVLGFLSHYATDCTVHPFIVMLCQPGMPYEGAGGHGYSEIAIDSWLHEKDTGSPCVPVDDSTPLLTGAALAQVGTLLQTAIRDALGITVSREALADTFFHTRMLRRLFISQHKIKYGIFWLAEPLFGGRGFITGHVTPAKLKPLPDTWINPFTHAEEKDDIEALLQKAEERSAGLMQKALDYWQGLITEDALKQAIGSNSYLSGMPDKRSAPQLFLQEKEQPET